MNFNQLVGTLSFLIWSSMCTWYYVNYIKFPKDPTIVEGAEVPLGNEEEETSEIQFKDATEISEPVPTKESNIVEVNSTELPVDLLIEKSFTFYKNSTQLISPQLFENFRDSLVRVTSNRQVSIYLIGHTCNLGTEEFNKQLGLDRATAINDQLIHNFKDITISSKGLKDPAFPNDTESNRTKNRRVEIKLESL